VAFAPGRHAEEMAEGVEGHGTRLSFRRTELSARAPNAKTLRPLPQKRQPHNCCPTSGWLEWPEMRRAMREPVEPEPVRTGGGKVTGCGTDQRKHLGFTSPVAWRSEDETHHSCSGIDLGFERGASRRRPFSRSIPMTVSSPTGGRAPPSRRRSRRSAAATCNSSARATGRRSFRASGWRARGRRRTWSSASTPT
jgi:hypothetical protein